MSKIMRFSIVSFLILSFSGFVLVASPKDYDEKKVREILELAKSDMPGYLGKAIARHVAEVKDYSGMITKRERIRGKLGRSQEVEFQFREKPYSVLLRWKKNAGRVDKLLYVKGSNDNKMIVHPTGAWSWVKSVKRDPYCKEALRSTRFTCDKLGFYNRMKRLKKLYDDASKEGEVQINCLGSSEVSGRKCIEIESVLPKSSKYEERRIELKLDEEYLLPIEFKSFDDKGRLLNEYTYSDLKLNVGFKDMDFAPATNGL